MQRQANILIDDDGEPRIAGFSIARSVDSQGILYPSVGYEVGSLRCQPPESRSHGGPLGPIAPSLASDVYAFAYLCLEVSILRSEKSFS